MTWGKELEFLLSLKEDGKVDPPALRNRPQLTPKELYYQEVFSDIADSRAFSMSGAPLPIPLTEIKAYCEFFGINDLTSREVLFRLVRAMDKAFMDTAVEQMKAAQPKDTNTVPAIEG